MIRTERLRIHFELRPKTSGKLQQRTMDIFGDVLGGERPRNCPAVTNLFNAASRNQLEKLNDIICKNLDIDFTESVNSFNCFHVAAQKGHIKIVKRLHEVCPNIISSRTTDNQRSSLMLASFEGHEQVAKYLSNFEVTENHSHQ